MMWFIYQSGVLGMLYLERLDKAEATKLNDGVDTKNGTEIITRDKTESFQFKKNRLNKNYKIFCQVKDDWNLYPMYSWDADFDLSSYLLSIQTLALAI